MNEQNAIVKAQPQSASVIRTMDDAERAAKAMVASGFFQDTKQMSQAVVKILAGQELGFGPFASMTGVSIIQNKPTVGANLMAAAVKRTGKYNYRVTVITDRECEIQFYEDGKPAGVSKFTMDDAVKAGLTTKDNWRKYPRNMLFARALSNGQRWYAPDVFGGATVYTPDELGAVVDEEGNAVGGPTWTGSAVEAGEDKPTGNPDPIDDRAWDMWLALCNRAEKVNIGYANVNRSNITKVELRAAYKELQDFVEQAEDQAKNAG